MSDWQGLNFPQETSKERAERVQAAKKKLKSFRAKQNALSSSQFASTASIDATSPPPISTRSTPTESPNPHIQHERKESRSKHAHRRSKSTNKFIPALHAPPQVNAEFQGQGHYGAAPGFAFPQNPNQQHFSRPSNSHTRRPSSKSYGVGGSHAHKRSKNSSISISVSKLRPQSQSGVGFKNNVFLQPKFNSSAESVSSQASATSGNGSVRANGNGRATGNLNSNWTFPRSPSSEMSNSEASPSTPRGGGGVIGGHSHKRTMSRHRRVGSVSNRSDSLSIMGGLPVSQALSLLSIPPHPVTSNQSTPTASPNPAGLGEMDTRLGFPVAPGLGGGIGAHGLRKSWGGERMSALAKLEGRMRNSNASSNYGGSDDVIDLESCSDENVSMSSPAGVGYGAERGAGLGRRPGSWSHAPGQGSLGGGPGGLGLGIGGGEGARELGMLVEEDEEEEEEGGWNHGRKGSREHGRKSSKEQHSRKTSGNRSPEGSLKEKEKKKRPTTLYIPQEEKFDRQATQSPPTSPTSATRQAQPSAGAKQFTFPARSTPPTKFAFPSASLDKSPNPSRTMSSHQSFSSQDSHSTGTAGSTNASVDAGNMKKGLRSLTLSFSSSAGPEAVASPVTPNGRGSWIGNSGPRSGSIAGLKNFSPAGEAFSVGRRGSLSRGNSFNLGKRSSISYRKDSVPTPLSSGLKEFAFPSTPAMNGGGFGDLELDDEGSATSDEMEVEKLKKELKKKEEEMAALKSEGSRLLRDAKGRYSELERRMAEEKEDLNDRIEDLEGSLKRSREAMESGTKEKVVEIEALRREMDGLHGKLDVVQLERDELREQTQVWRVKAEELKEALEKEKTKVEEEKKENMIAREKIRKLGDRLTEGINAEVATQTKLVNEMKDQVFSLMASLEKERKEHELTKKELASEKEKRLFDELIDEMQEEEDEIDVPRDEEITDSLTSQTVVPLVTRSSSQHMYTGTQSSDISNYSNTSSFSFYDPARRTSSLDTSAFNSDEEPFYRSPSSSQFSLPGLGFKSREGSTGDYPVPAMALGGLQTLAEEEEEEEDNDTKVSEVLQPLPPLEDPVHVYDEEGMIGTWQANATNYVGSVPPTPAVPQVSPLNIMVGKPSKHERKESFVKTWSFPKGTAPKYEEDEEDDSFFNYNAAPTLPPLPMSASMFNLPAALSAGLELAMQDAPAPVTPTTPAHFRRPSSPRPHPATAPVGGVPMTPRRSSTFSSMPPVARSAHMSASLSGSKDFGAIDAPLPSASSGSSLAKRLSLQSFASLFGSYATISPTATAIAVGASKLCAGPERASIDGRFDDVTQPLMSRGTTTTQSPRNSAVLNMNRISRRFVDAKQQPVPVQARLSQLDFTNCCASCCDHNKGLIMV